MSTPTDSSIRIEEEIQFYDTDCGGVVHNLAYLRLIEKARGVLCREVLGLDLKSMDADQLFPAVTRTEVDYLKPARLGDRIEVRGSFEKIGRIRMICQFEISPVREPETILNRCRQTLVLVQMPEGKAKRVPKEWRS